MHTRSYNPVEHLTLGVLQGSCPIECANTIQFGWAEEQTRKTNCGAILNHLIEFNHSVDIKSCFHIVFRIPNHNCRPGICRLLAIWEAISIRLRKPEFFSHNRFLTRSTRHWMLQFIFSYISVPPWKELIEKKFLCSLNGFLYLYKPWTYHGHRLSQLDYPNWNPHHPNRCCPFVSFVCM